MHAGQPNGPFVVFHPDGRVAQRGTFRQGQLVDSLVTTSPTGSPRLLARFDSSRAPGLRGTFRQWGSQYTADFMAVISHWGDGTSGGSMSSNNTYPRRDSARYWVGQLAAGRLVGAYTEYDADGEPRVRLSYTAQGQYRLTTLYYPAVWLRNEQGRDQPIPADSVVHSRPMFEWQAVGRPPYLLQRHWSSHYGSTTTTTTAQTELFQLVPYQRGHTFLSDVVGVLDRPAISQLPPLPASVVLPAPQPPGCRGLYAQEVARRRAAFPTSGSGVDYQQLRQLPLISLQKLPHPGRWRLGVADTTGTSLQPVRQRTTPLADGRRVVEQFRTTRTYFASGTLESSERHRLLGGTRDRGYYPSGARKEEVSEGWLGTYSRAWDEAGHRTKSDYESPVDMRRVRNYLKRAHPLRALKQKLRRFHPMRPVYRRFQKIFPKKDHHKPTHP